MSMEPKTLIAKWFMYSAKVSYHFSYIETQSLIHPIKPSKLSFLQRQVSLVDLTSEVKKSDVAIYIFVDWTKSKKPNVEECFSCGLNVKFMLKLNNAESFLFCFVCFCILDWSSKLKKYLETKLISCIDWAPRVSNITFENFPCIKP